MMDERCVGRSVCALAVSVVGLAMAGGAGAQTRAFTAGGDGTSWTDASNWGGDVPDTVAESASIDAGRAFDVLLSDTFSVDDFVLGSDDSLLITGAAGAPEQLTANTATVQGDLRAGAFGVFLSNTNLVNDGRMYVDDFGLIGTQRALTNSGGGELRGKGLFSLGFVTNDGVVNHGLISPGDDAGVGTPDGGLLRMQGGLTMSGTSVLDIEIGGGTTNFSFDQLEVGGTLALGGTLNVTMYNGFVPDPQVRFAVVQSILVGGRSGSFVNAVDGDRLLTTDGSGTFLVEYDDATSSVVLTDFELIPEPASVVWVAMGAAVGLLGRRRA